MMRSDEQNDQTNQIRWMLATNNSQWNDPNPQAKTKENKRRKGKLKNSREDQANRIDQMRANLRYQFTTKTLNPLCIKGTRQLVRK